MTAEPPLSERYPIDPGVSVVATGARPFVDVAACEACGSILDVITLAAGGTRRVDRAVRRDPLAGLVAYNPASGRGHLIREDEVDRARGWSAKGIRFYAPHTLTCLYRGRDDGEQLTLEGRAT